jgi:hypothetical protein
VVYTDSQSVQQYLISRGKSAETSLVRNILETVRKLKEEHGIQVNLQWVSSHTHQEVPFPDQRLYSSKQTVAIGLYDDQQTTCMTEWFFDQDIPQILHLMQTLPCPHRDGRP